MKFKSVFKKAEDFVSKKIDLNKFQEVVGQLKTAQKQLKTLVNQETIKEAKKYAETSSKEIKKWIKNTRI